MFSTLSNEQIIASFEAHLAVNPDRLEILAQNTGHFGQLYRVETEQGNFMLRIGLPDNARGLFYEKGEIEREVEILDLVQGKTSMPVPKVVAADFSRSLLNRDYLITEALPGILYSEITSLSHAKHDQVFFQVGQHLKQLHAIIGTAYGYNGPQSSMELQQTWKEAFVVRWGKLIKDVEAGGLYSSDEATGLETLLESYTSYFERNNPPSLLHMGIGKENILVDPEGNVTGLLGLEFALWGDPEIEFAVLDCTGIWASSFWEGYGMSRPNDIGSRTRRKFYILYEVQKNMPLAVWRNNDYEEAEQYKQTTMTIATNLASTEP